METSHRLRRPWAVAVGSRWVSSSRSIGRTSTRLLAHVSLGGQSLPHPAFRIMAVIIEVCGVHHRGARCCRCDLQLETGGGGYPLSVRLMPERARNAAARQYPSAGKRRNSPLSAFLLLQATGPRRPVVSFFEGEVHALVAAVLLRVARLDALDSLSKAAMAVSSLRALGVGAGTYRIWSDRHPEVPILLEQFPRQ
ncbi:hypothetical protein ACVIGB_004677 [Bradyrhizobium sp. USDA 4341]